MVDIPYSPANDLQFLKQGFVVVNGVPTHCITCGRWIDETLPDNDKMLILFIPGNPGAVEYYEEFVSALYEGLQRTVPIWGISHAGHVAPPSGQQLPKLQGNDDLYNLEGQISHKIAFINMFVPKDRQIVLIGHSIGCYMVLEILIGIILIIPVCLLMPNLFRFVRYFSTMATNVTEYIPGTHSIAYVTAPNEEVAKKLADGLVSKKLAACVNVIPNIYSVYEWKNEINRDPEVLMMIKTRTSRLEELTTYVRENHPYEVCEVISVPIQQGNPPYLQWVGDIVKDKLE